MADNKCPDIQKNVCIAIAKSTYKIEKSYSKVSRFPKSNYGPSTYIIMSASEGERGLWKSGRSKRDYVNFVA